MAETENSLNISPQQFLDQCSPNELRELEFFSADEKDLKIDLLQNFDVTMFSMMRGNGKVVKVC